MLKKMAPWLIIILVAITLIMGTAVALWFFFISGQDKGAASPTDEARQSVDKVEAVKLNAAQLRELTVEMNEILTNLSNKDFVKISFAFELENKQAKEEFELLDFKVKDIVIQTLADLAPDQIQGSKGMDFLTTTLMNKINLVLTKGKLKHINITNFILS